MKENITVLRKYGGCVLAATQSINQLFSYYGRNDGSIMLGQFNTSIIFRISEVEEAKVITKRIGEMEYLIQQKNVSYGAHEVRDGISYTEQEKKQDLVRVSDLSQLKEHQAYVLLPEQEVALSKIKLRYINRPMEVQEKFVRNPRVDKMLSMRRKNWQEQRGKDMGKKSELVSTTEPKEINLAEDNREE